MSARTFLKETKIIVIIINKRLSVVDGEDSHVHQGQSMELLVCHSQLVYIYIYINSQSWNIYFKK